MITAAVLAVLAIVLFGPAGVLLARSMWPSTSPAPPYSCGRASVLRERWPQLVRAWL